MNLSKFNAFSKQGFVEECKTFFSATFIALMVFGGTYAYDTFAATSTQTNTLTVTIANAVTFNAYTDSFGTLTPGTPKYATTTTVVTTNATAWNIQLYGNNVGTTTASTTLYIAADTATDNKIPDSTQWVPGGGGSPATTTIGNAGSASGSTTLAFRVMTASGTYAFLAPTWWGTSDVNLNASQKWAGIASSTATFLTGRRIGIVNVYNSATYKNTVQYYLDVPSSQKQGAYTGDLTFTFTDSA